MLFVPVRRFCFSSALTTKTVLGRCDLGIMLVFLAVNILVLFVTVFGCADVDVTRADCQTGRVTAQHLLNSSGGDVF